MDPRIAGIEKTQLRSDVPAFAPGDTIRVRVRVSEGAKERIQAFEGICIARKGAGLSETFNVRKISGGVGVERIFPVHSPTIEGIEVVRRGHVRRAKLYYLRARRGKRARVRERRWWEGGVSQQADDFVGDELDSGAEIAAQMDATDEAAVEELVEVPADENVTSDAETEKASE